MNSKKKLKKVFVTLVFLPICIIFFDIAKIDVTFHAKLMLFDM